ncbi:hypothetical protein BDZ91DRAFT_713701 [Kalaharituber pfeilii]|nr:hypothetical protein BDZ91DRAFT_713701 [Kalaharituber pfeilii]
MELELDKEAQANAILCLKLLNWLEEHPERYPDEALVEVLTTAARPRTAFSDVDVPRSKVTGPSAAIPAIPPRGSSLCSSSSRKNSQILLCPAASHLSAITAGTGNTNMMSKAPSRPRRASDIGPRTNGESGRQQTLHHRYHTRVKDLRAWAKMCAAGSSPGAALVSWNPAGTLGLGGLEAEFTQGERSPLWDKLRCSFAKPAT